jgi:hypothetical protein
VLSPFASPLLLDSRASLQYSSSINLLLTQPDRTPLINLTLEPEQIFLAKDNDENSRRPDWDCMGLSAFSPFHQRARTANLPKTLGKYWVILWLTVKRALEDAVWKVNRSASPLAASA